MSKYFWKTFEMLWFFNLYRIKQFHFYGNMLFESKKFWRLLKAEKVHLLKNHFPWNSFFQSSEYFWFFGFFWVFSKGKILKIFYDKGFFWSIEDALKKLFKLNDPLNFVFVHRPSPDWLKTFVSFPSRARLKILCVRLTGHVLLSFLASLPPFLSHSHLWSMTWTRI